MITTKWKMHVILSVFGKAWKIICTYQIILPFPYCLPFEKESLPSKLWINLSLFTCFWSNLLSLLSYKSPSFLLSLHIFKILESLKIVERLAHKSQAHENTNVPPPFLLLFSFLLPPFHRRRRRHRHPPPSSANTTTYLRQRQPHQLSLPNWPWPLLSYLVKFLVRPFSSPPPPPHWRQRQLLLSCFSI